MLAAWPAAAEMLSGKVKKLITTATLDKIAGPVPSRGLLKIDVQGTELEVLEGGEKTLSTCEAVQLEIALLPYNDGAPGCSMSSVIWRSAILRRLTLAGSAARTAWISPRSTCYLRVRRRRCARRSSPSNRRPHRCALPPAVNRARL